MENVIPYVDLLKRKKTLGWKKERKIRSREDINKYVYEELINKLYENESEKIRVIIAGPSNEELEYAQKIFDRKFEVYIFEPDKKRYEEIKSFLMNENIRVVNDYIYNIQNYDELKADFIILLNVINWKPTYPLKLLKGLYEKLSKRGIVALSLYIEIFPNSKDKKYIIKTPLHLKETLERNSIEKYSEIYSDSNGVLKLYVLNKLNLSKIIKSVENRISELKEEVNFYAI